MLFSTREFCDGVTLLVNKNYFPILAHWILHEALFTIFRYFKFVITLKFVKEIREFYLLQFIN